VKEGTTQDIEKALGEASVDVQNSVMRKLVPKFSNTEAALLLANSASSSKRTPVSERATLIPTR